MWSIIENWPKSMRKWIPKLFKNRCESSKAKFEKLVSSWDWNTILEVPWGAKSMKIQCRKRVGSRVWFRSRFLKDFGWFLVPRSTQNRKKTGSKNKAILRRSWKVVRGWKAIGTSPGNPLAHPHMRARWIKKTLGPKTQAPKTKNQEPRTKSWLNDWLIGWCPGSDTPGARGPANCCCPPKIKRPHFVNFIICF